MLRGPHLILGLVVLAGPALAVPACPQRPEADTARNRIQEVMAKGRFVAYVPTALKVVDGRTTPADEASIREDLKTLRPRFDGVITYSARDGIEWVPDVAASLGFKAVIMGIWDPGNTAEVANVAAAVTRNPGVVTGVSVGNEMVLGGRADAAAVARAVQAVRARAPKLAVTTTEPFHLFLQPEFKPVLAQIDLLLANVHPVFESWFRQRSDDDAAQFVINISKMLTGVYCGPVLVKETGVPTAPESAGYTAARQASFYRVLRGKFTASRDLAFAYFSAFDAPWRANDAHPVAGAHPEEAYWGLYDAARNPKPVVAGIPELPR